MRISIALFLACSTAVAAERQIAPRLTMGETTSVPAAQAGITRSPDIAFANLAGLAGPGAGSAAAQAAGRYLLVYQDGYNGFGGNSDIMGLLLNPKGELIGKPFAICEARGAQDSPVVAACGGRFLVAWSDFRNERDYDVYAAVVDASGKVGAEFRVAGGDEQPGGQAGPAAASNGKDEFFVVWQDNRVGNQAGIYGVRVSMDGRPVDTGGVRLSGGADPRVAFSGGRYFVTVGTSGFVVGADGKAGVLSTLWNDGRSGACCITAAYGKALELLNATPSPDPWGWGGSGAIVGLTVNPDGTCPEDKAAVHGRAGAADLADRITKNVIEAARWKNCAGWPCGRPGGFKGSSDGTWPSGQPAAVFNGRSLLVAWPSANFIDRLLIGNRDLYLKRVVDGWHGIDERPLKIVAGATEEVSPVMASDGEGGAILAWERQNPAGGVIVDFAPVFETPDAIPPRIAYIQKMSATRMILGFDEPIAAASVKTGCVAVAGAAVASVAYNPEGPAFGRELVVDTEPLTVGKTYPITVSGVSDTLGNAARGEPFAYVARPGAAQRTLCLSQWLSIAKWPADFDADYIGAAGCRPSPGDVVRGLSDAELMSHMNKVVSPEKYLELARQPMETAVPADFAGDKTWVVSKTRWANSVLDFIDAGYGKRSFALAYAHTYIWSDNEREVMLRIDSNNGHRAWLNGKVISDQPLASKLTSRAIHDRTDEVATKLEKGWNRLLVGVDSYIFTWGLLVQITDLDRQPVRDLTYQIERPSNE